jgi:Protein of unknown function (DUF3455)
VNSSRSKRGWGGRAAQSIIRRSLAVAALATLSVSGIAYAQGRAEDSQDQIPNPNAPAALTPPAGNSAFLLGHAVGTQGYVCLPTSTGASWTVNAARPEATLFKNGAGEVRQIITHFLSPNTNPNQFAPNRCPSATPPGRAPSIAARCGHNRHIQSLPAPIRVARMPARFPASCCRSSDRRRGRPEVNA